MPMAFERKEDENEKNKSYLYGVPYWHREAIAPSDYTTIRDGDIAISAIPLFGRF